MCWVHTHIGLSVQDFPAEELHAAYQPIGFALCEG